MQVDGVESGNGHGHGHGKDTDKGSGLRDISIHSGRDTSSNGSGPSILCGMPPTGKVWDAALPNRCVSLPHVGIKLGIYMNLDGAAKAGISIGYWQVGGLLRSAHEQTHT